MKFILGVITTLILFSCATPMTQRGEVEQAAVEREAEIQKELAFKSGTTDPYQQCRILRQENRFQLRHIDQLTIYSG